MCTSCPSVVSGKAGETLGPRGAFGLRPSGRLRKWHFHVHCVPTSTCLVHGCVPGTVIDLLSPFVKLTMSRQHLSPGAGKYSQFKAAHSPKVHRNSGNLARAPVPDRFPCNQASFSGPCTRQPALRCTGVSWRVNGRWLTPYGGRSRLHQYLQSTQSPANMIGLVQTVRNGSSHNELTEEP